MIRRLPSFAVLGVMAAVVLLSASCGVAIDEAPQPLPINSLPENLRPGSLPEEAELEVAAGASQPIYMVGPDERLFQVFRAVPAEPNAVMQELLGNVTANERENGIGSALTRSTSVIGTIDVNPLFQLATITLGPDSVDERVQEQLLTFGQIVFTLTEIDGIESVSFRIQRGSGTESLAVRTDGAGLTNPGESVQRADFASIDPGNPIVPTFPNEDAPTTPVPTSAPSGIGNVIEVPIWVLNPDNQLVQVTRQVERNPAALTQTLLDGVLAAEGRQGFRSAINEDALANSVRVLQVVDDERGALGTAVVDLSSESLPPIESNDEQRLAVAQIVFTLTGLVEVDQVLFTVDGVPTPMPTQNGLSAEYDLEDPAAGALTRSDYSEYALAIRIIERPTITPVPDAVDPNAASAPEPTTAPAPEPTPTPTP